MKCITCHQEINFQTWFSATCPESETGEGHACTPVGALGIRFPEIVEEPPIIGGLRLFVSRVKDGLEKKEDS